MALKVWATQNAVDTTGTGTTDFVHGSITDTPVAVLHAMSNGQTAGSAVNQGRMAFGMSDGTDQRAVSIGINHAQATSDTSYLYSTADSIAACFTSSTVEDGAMSHNSFIAGGQRLNNDNAFNNACLCNSIFFKCDNAKVMTATLNATVDTAVNVDPGFAWDAVIFIGNPKTAASGDDAEIYLGFFDGTNQGSLVFNSANGVSPGDPGFQISDSYVGGELGLGTGTTDYMIEAVVGTGTSIDLYPRTNGGDTDPVYCLFLGWSTNEQVKVVSWDSPTGTGDNNITSVGFRPQSAIHLLSFAAAYDTAEADADAGSFGVSFETGNEQFCTTTSDEFSTGGNSNVQSLTDDQSINVPTDAGAAGYAATFNGFLSNGWGHNFTATQGAANKFISLVFEQEEALPGVVQSVEYVELTYNDASDGNTALTKGQNTGQCVPFFTAFHINTLADDFRDRSYKVDIYNDGGTPSVRIIATGRTTASVSCTIKCFIVEFKHSINVQKVSGGIANTSTSNNITITDVGAQNNAFFIYTYDFDDTVAVDTANDACVRAKWNGASTTSITLEREGTNGDITGWLYVVDCDSSEFIVDHQLWTMGNTDESTTTTISSTVEADTFLINHYMTDGSNDNPLDNAVVVDLSNSTTLRSRRSIAGASTGIISHATQVIECQNSEWDVQRGTMTMSTTNPETQNITAVNLASSIVKTGTHDGSKYDMGTSDVTTGNNVDALSVAAEFNSTTQFQLDRRSDTETGNLVPWEVIDFEGVAAAAPSNISYRGGNRGVARGVMRGVG